MNKIESTPEINKLITQLSNKENIEALELLVDKLPNIASLANSIEELSIFAKSTYNDKKSMGELFDQVDDRLEGLGLNKQTLESMIVLLQLIPKVMPAIKSALEGIEFISGVLKDQESVQYIMNELEPVTGKFKEMAALITETNKRYAKAPVLPGVSIFKLVSLLKDENVRKGYKYLQTFLTVLAENKAIR